MKFFSVFCLLFLMTQAFAEDCVNGVCFSKFSYSSQYRNYPGDNTSSCEISFYFANRLSTLTNARGEKASCQDISPADLSVLLKRVGARAGAQLIDELIRSKRFYRYFAADYTGRPGRKEMSCDIYINMKRTHVNDHLARLCLEADRAGRVSLGR